MVLYLSFNRMRKNEKRKKKRLNEPDFILYVYHSMYWQIANLCGFLLMTSTPFSIRLPATVYYFLLPYSKIEVEVANKGYCLVIFVH